MKTDQTKLNPKEIKKQAGSFTASVYETEDIELRKKDDLENADFIVISYKGVNDGEGGVYYNFKCLDEADKEFCFNGSSILVSQLENADLPIWVKLVKIVKEGKPKPFNYYWAFTNPE